LNDKAPGSRLVILGLDGVGWSLIERLTTEGVMPRLAALVKESSAGSMMTTLPEISPVAWTTFFTGRPPGWHGIFGFTEFQPGDYRVRMNSSAHIRVPTVWDKLSLSNRRSVILNVPMTYPAQPLAGVMVSGFVSSDLARAAYPARVAEYLKYSGYRLEADFEVVHRDREAFLQELDQTLRGRLDLLERFWPTDWDLFFLVLAGTDRINHFFYREYENRGPTRQRFLDYYARVDEAVGRVHDLTVRLAEDETGETCLVMLSDHGFCGITREFHLNRFLSAHGFQDEAGPKALALALDPTRIYFNQAPRFQAGRPAGSWTSALARELTAALMAEPAVSQVFDGEGLYSGPARSLAPDLVIQPARGYEFKAKFTPGPIYTDSPLQGSHTREDAFFLIHHPVEKTGQAEITDILDLSGFIFSRLKLDADGGSLRL